MKFLQNKIKKTLGGMGLSKENIIKKFEDELGNQLILSENSVYMLKKIIEAGKIGEEENKIIENIYKFLNHNIRQQKFSIDPNKKAMLKMYRGHIQLLKEVENEFDTEKLNKIIEDFEELNKNYKDMLENPKETFEKYLKSLKK